MANGEGGFITEANTLAEKIEAWKKKGYHVLSPSIKISTFPPGYGINASLVMVDPTVDEDGNGPDCYFDRNTMEDDERAPGKYALARIAAAIGVNWIEPYGRKDPMTIQNLWIYQVTGEYRTYDGTWQTIKGEKEIDYRDGSAQIGEWSREAQTRLDELNRKLPPGTKPQYAINGWSEKRVRQARCNGAERAETGALERAIRTLGVHHTYKIEQLRYPFVALRVSEIVDMAGDHRRRAEVERGSEDAQARMYPRRETRQLPEPAPVLDIPVHRVAEPVVVSEPVSPPPPVTVVAPAPPPPAQQPGPVEPKAPPVQPKADMAVPDGAVVITDVQEEKKPYSQGHAKHGQNFTIYTVYDSTGARSVTTFNKWGLKAKSMKNKGPVFLQLAPENKYGEREILNIKTADEAKPKTAALQADMDL